MRRLRVRPRQPGLRGPRESPPGPTTWVRPQGLVERMNAGRKSLRDQGDLENGSFRLQKAVSRSKENAAVERREANAQRYWACAAKRNEHGSVFRRSAPLTFGAGAPLVSEGNGNPGAPRALREQGRRSFDFFRAPAV